MTYTESKFHGCVRISKQNKLKLQNDNRDLFRAYRVIRSVNSEYDIVNNKF